MKSKFYICEYCMEEYIPRRRNHQKYCSSSCRSKAYHIRERDKDDSPTSIEVAEHQTNEITTTDEVTIPEKPKIGIDKMTTAGVANAAAGSAIVQAFTSIMTREENRTVQKKDLGLIDKKLRRYYKVSNLSKRIDQTVPIFDSLTEQLLYVSIFQATKLLNPETNF